MFVFLICLTMLRCFYTIVGAVKLIKLRKKVLNVEETGSGSNWKKGAWVYHANNVLRRCESKEFELQE